MGTVAEWASLHRDELMKNWGGVRSLRSLNETG